MQLWQDRPDRPQPTNQTPHHTTPHQLLRSASQAKQQQQQQQQQSQVLTVWCLNLPAARKKEERRKEGRKGTLREGEKEREERSHKRAQSVGVARCHIRIFTKIVWRKNIHTIYVMYSENALLHAYLNKTNSCKTVYIKTSIRHVVWQFWCNVRDQRERVCGVRRWLGEVRPDIIHAHTLFQEGREIWGWRGWGRGRGGSGWHQWCPLMPCFRAKKVWQIEIS